MSQSPTWNYQSTFRLSLFPEKKKIMAATCESLCSADISPCGFDLWHRNCADFDNLFNSSGVFTSRSVCVRFRGVVFTGSNSAQLSCSSAG